MATKRTRRTYTYTIPGFLRTLSYIVVLMIALAIAIGAVLGWWKEFAAIAGYIKGIAMTIGLIVLCWYSYYDARMRNRTWFIVWVVAVIIVIVFQILGFAMPTLW
ncbi:MAG: hypothetical protein HFK08_04735 [Clostridia bacterium]|nr:hypothetical protein [Clostridia bacterium]